MSCYLKGIVVPIALICFGQPALAYELPSVEAIAADNVHRDGITGRGVIVAVIDTGVDGPFNGLHMASGGLSIIGEEYHPEDYGYPVGDMHGTEVSLIIAGFGGVAPGAKILSIRVVDASGYAQAKDIALAIKYATGYKNRVRRELRVINLSVGGGLFSCSCDQDIVPVIREEAQAITAASDAGIVTVCCTGNDASCFFPLDAGIWAPSCASDAVRAVAGFYKAYSQDFPHTDSCTDFHPPVWSIVCNSNFADACNYVVGPGAEVLIRSGGEHLWGTSYAAAHVSGVAALMFSKAGPASTMTGREAAHKLWVNGVVLGSARPPCPQAGQPTWLLASQQVRLVDGPLCGVFGDLDGDETVSADDFHWLEGCMAGPGGPAPADVCACAKSLAKARHEGPDNGKEPAFEGTDGGIDMHDFAQFQLAFTGYGSGACCHPPPYPQCTIESVDVCAAEFGATYQGHGTTCENVECPSPNWGACCYIVELNCSEDAVENCVWQDGMYMGDGSTCAALTCPTGRYHNVIDPPTNYTPCGDGLQLADDITLNGDQPAGLAYYDIAVYGGGGGSFDVTVELYTECPGRGGTLIPGTERTFTDNPDNGSPAILSAVFDPPVYMPNQFWMVATFSNSQAGWFRADQAEIGRTENYFGRNDGGDPPWVCDYWWGPDEYAGYWANIGCVAPYGACCHADFSCTDGNLAECDAAGGAYQGYGTACATEDCYASRTGACCLPDEAACETLTPSFCVQRGGTYLGDETPCNETNCPLGRYRNTIGHPNYYGAAEGDRGLADDMTLAGTGARDLVYYDLLVYGGNTEEEPVPFDVTASIYTACPGEGGTLIPGTTFTWNAIPQDGHFHLLQVDLSGWPATIPDTPWMAADFSSNIAGWCLGGHAEIGYTTTAVAGRLPPWLCHRWYGPYLWGGYWANLRCVADGGERSGGAPVLSMTTVPAQGVPVRVEHDPSPAPVSVPQSHARGTAVSAADLTGGRPSDRNPPYLSLPDTRRQRLVGAKARSPATVTLNLVSPSGGHSVQPGDEIQWSISATVSQGDNAGLALVIVDLVQDAANPEKFDIPPATAVGSGMDGFDRPNGIANPSPGGADSAYGGTPVGPAGAMNLAQIGGAQNTFGERGETIGQDLNVDPSIGLPGPQVIAAGSFLAPETFGIYTFRLDGGLANVLNSIQPPPSLPNFWPVSAATVTVVSPSFSFAVGEVACTHGDMNDDAVLDARDIQPFVITYLNSSEVTPQQRCAADCDDNGLLDSADVPRFVNKLLQADP